MARLRYSISKAFVLSVFGFILCLTLSSDVFAQSGRAGAFLRIGAGARAKAMGDAYTAMPGGVESTYYNPAGLPFLETREVILSYRLLSFDRQFSYIGIGIPIRPKSQNTDKPVLHGGVSFSWFRAGVGDIDGRNTDGGRIGSFSNNENAFVFSFGLKPAKWLGVGLTVKVVWNRFPGIGIDDQTISANSAGVDFGAIAFPTNWLNLAVVVKELNAKYRWNTEDLFGEDDGSETTNHFPKVVRYAAAAKIPQLKGVTVALDYEQIYDKDLFKDKLANRYHIGAESILKDVIAVRAGFDDGSVTAGAGYSFPLFGKTSQLNYAYSSPGDRPEDEHIFTWILDF